jgi:hypothetical protein
MIAIGGSVTTSSQACDVPHLGGQHGLLLGQESVENGSWWWRLSHTYNDYRVPDKLVSLVGGKYVNTVLHLKIHVTHAVVVLAATPQRRHQYKAGRHRRFRSTSKVLCSPLLEQQRDRYQLRQRRT